jgi:hypothetical protein
MTNSAVQRLHGQSAVAPDKDQDHRQGRQTRVLQPLRDDMPSSFPEGSANRRKQLQVNQGPDTLVDAQTVAKQGACRSAAGRR